MQDSIHALPSNESAPPAHQRLSQICAAARVLIVDDIEANRTLLRRRLRRLGIEEILEAEDGASGLALIRASNIDLVLLDIMMPVMNGFEVLEIIAREGILSEVPVIIISALDEMDAIVRGIELGAEDFLLKPFEPTLLRARVLATLEKQHLRSQQRQALAQAQMELLEARSLQMALVPNEYTDPQIAVRIILEPAREIGGDLVDHIPLDDGIHLLVLGDVSGKGAGAALVMARTHALIRSCAVLGQADGKALQLENIAMAVNAALSKDNDSCTFVTTFFALFDTGSGELSYLRCGHVPPFVRRRTGAVERLELAGGLPLGLVSDTIYQTASTRLDPGETLLLISDGVTEAISAHGEFFGEEDIFRWLGECRHDLGNLVKRVRNFENGMPPTDDLSALTLTRHSH
ncbi:PP2C family protein-serine/threonine phosphatase [Novosphingobium fuchskuhlense]|nr:fused response regulator/phosphatase [Novosphingobium fuchskuhlense]